MTETDAMRHYVYTLAYPDGSVFYVGKGVGDRINAHEREARSGAQSPKCAIIRAIWAQGGEVCKTRVAYFASDEEAARYERLLVSSYDGLANVQGGGEQFVEAFLAPEDLCAFGASIRQVDEHGRTYWSARETANYLGYANWAPFKRVLTKAERALAASGADTIGDFLHITVQVGIGLDTQRAIEDVRLSRTAFLLVVQNADPAKSMVACGKSYIAAQAARSAGVVLPVAAPSWAMVSYRPHQMLRGVNPARDEEDA